MIFIIVLYNISAVFGCPFRQKNKPDYRSRLVSINNIYNNVINLGFPA
jgi:hypothetical protein